VNNTEQVYISTSGFTNIWDDGYPSGGNYWSDYTGVDANGDGIGDTPYVIDVDNQDRYPLMHPWSPLPVHNINTGLGYAAMQEAINANETLSEHVIFVETGKYDESVVVNKTLTLIGENRYSTTIDGRGMSTVVDIVANNVVISGFTVQNSGVGIYNGGIRVFYHANVVIENNNLARNFVGVWLFGASNCTVDGNIVEHSDTGIRVDYSSNSIISGNSVTNNTYGITVDWSSCITVYRNNVTNCDYFGVSFYQTNDSCVENNLVVDAQNGISLGSSSNNTIEINNVTNSNLGIWVDSSSNNTISGNNVSSNSYIGIRLDYSSTNKNVISNNIVSNNNYGIFLASSANSNTVFGNDIVNNNYGIYLSGTADNMFFHNNIVDNILQVVSYDSTNLWDDGYPSGGNYWSDYTGVDVKSCPNQDLPGSDGIGDTPYVIDPNNVDHYPLMNPHGSPPPTTYALTITVTVGGTTNPAPGTYGYTTNQTVQVTAIPYANVTLPYQLDHWELDNIDVGSANPYNVSMDTNHMLKAVFSLIPLPLSAFINPLSASVLVGQSLTFTSTVSGGYAPYGYQWYLNGNLVSGANLASWAFTPTTSGMYYVILKVTDAKGNTTQSETAHITVATIPVGGYSLSIELPTTAKPLTIHIALLTILTAILITIKRKAKRKHRSSIF
jgi:parallel beta-helix repeat protein